MAEISIRPFRVSDADDFYSWASDDRVTEYLRWNSVKDREEALKYLKEIAIPHPWRRSICWANKSIGYISVKPESGADRHRAHISYAISVHFQGRGIATAAVKMAIRVVFRDLPYVVRIEALVEDENKGSQKILKSVSAMDLIAWRGLGTSLRLRLPTPSAPATRFYPSYVLAQGFYMHYIISWCNIKIYEAYSDYESMMNMAEEIVTRCAFAVHGKLSVDYQLGNDLDDVKATTLSALNMGPNNQDMHLIEACSSVGQVLNEVFEMVVEPTLVQPSFVLDYPVEISPLAKPTKLPHTVGLTCYFGNLATFVDWNQKILELIVGSYSVLVVRGFLPGLGTGIGTSTPVLCIWEPVSELTVPVPIPEPNWFRMLGTQNGINLIGSGPEPAVP
ncbi:hypothetical protein OSB04_000282 [Centaurea solstitialis]|uniref:N-acetyltransferase domain-containing protein n=1 Tax=Centaurea solstitialis TaxID=347529 RepID=A0AA38U1G3_9ASTR|nr:hypothetical protein OSB04_000282 [Centaurea solstitialis]